MSDAFVSHEAARRASEKLTDEALATAIAKESLHHFERAFGIECQHHYGITTHPFTAKASVGEMVYAQVRGWHPARENGYGLTDDNHTWRADYSSEGWSRVVIVKNAKSPLYERQPWWVEDGPGVTWFTQEFRVATQSRLNAEIAYHVKRAIATRADAARQRDTTRGRKARALYESFARGHDRLIGLVMKRWPEFVRGDPLSASNQGPPQ